MGNNNPRWGMNPTGAFQKVVLPWHKPMTPQQHEENVRALERIDWGAGQGTRWATIVFAAFNSTDLSKSTADYVCTGAGDQTLINAVISQLQTSRPAAAGIGRLVFLEGTYNLTSDIIINSLGARELIVQGMGGAGITTSVGATRFVQSAGNKAVFTLGGNPAAAGSTTTIMDMQMSAGSSVACVTTRDMPTVVRNCSLLNSGSGGGIGQSNSTGTGAASRFSDNYISCTGSNAIGILAAVGAAVDTPIIIEGNVVSVTTGGTSIFCVNDFGTIPTYIVNGNTVAGGTLGIGLNGNSIENCTVSGNIVRFATTGITCGGYRHTVSGNVVESCTTGISTASDSQFLALLANNVSSCTTAFVLANSATRPTIIGNKASQCTNAYSVAVGVTNAFIGYNDFGGAPGTDNGTNTTIVTPLPSGGLTGYVLTKLSNATGDYDWRLNAVIDLIAAKGDLLVGTAADTLIRYGTDRDGQIFITDSTETGGVRWGPKLTILPTAPPSPRPGDIWMDVS